MKLRIDDAVIDTKKSKHHWTEAQDWNGQNHISRNTGSQWAHQTLYLSSKGRYYLVHTSNWDGSLPSAEFISETAAAQWLALNDHEVPEAMAHMASE